MNNMNSSEIQNHIEAWAQTRDFTAPYGIIAGEFTNRSGRRVRAVTFGRARSLDATVEIYNRGFLILRTSCWGSETFNNLESLMARLETL